MIIVRQIREDDIDGLLRLAEAAYPGMTTLPPDLDDAEQKNCCGNRCQFVEDCNGTRARKVLTSYGRYRHWATGGHRWNYCPIG